MDDRSHVDESLRPARAAIERAEWATALELLDAAGEAVSTSAAGRELRGIAAYGAGDLEAAVTAFEDLHAQHAQQGEPEFAARAAGTVAMYLMMDTGLMSPVRAWLSRGDALLADVDDPDRAVLALLAMVRTYERFLCGDPDGARTWAERAIELGRDGRFPPAEAIGRVGRARLRILDGHVDEGLRALDEVAAMLMVGALDALTTGMVWCELICAVQGLGLYDRAEEWTTAMEQWRRRSAFGGLHGRCRVHRAEVLRLRGAYEQAEHEALLACDELRPWMRRELGWPLTELGTIRLRRGDLDGAEEAFREAHQRAWEPQPGLAMLRLARGDAEGAAALLADALKRPRPLPFKERPPFGELRRAPLLEAQVDVATTTGDAAVARHGADELGRIAARFASPSLHAAAGLARGRALLLEGDPAAAVAQLEQAVTAWVEVGTPHEAALARLELGRAHRAAGDPTCARLELEAARDELERLGSRLRVAEADALLCADVAQTPDPTHDPAPAPAADARTGAATAAVAEGARDGSTDDDGAAVFRCEGDVRTISFAGSTVLLGDLKGMRYLARLLVRPGHEVHVLDLVAAEHGHAGPGGVGARDVDAVTRGGDAGPVLDQQARAAYRRRLEEVRADIEEATRTNDLERRALAEADRDYLVDELARATGLHGRERRAGAAAERARSSVTRTLRYALDRIAEHHPELGMHLDRAVRTGTWCCYLPDQPGGVEWVTQPRAKPRA